MNAHPFHVGDRIPVALSREQLAAIIGVSTSRIDVLRAAHSHPAIKELLPRVGHPRFCGVAAQAWLTQRGTDEVRFFRSARQ